MIINPDSLGLFINQNVLATALGISDENFSSTSDYEYRVPATFITRAGQMKLIIKPEDEREGGVDEALIKSVARAHSWFEQLQAGQVSSIREIAERENLSASYVMKYLRLAFLAFLAPDIVEKFCKAASPRAPASKN